MDELELAKLLGIACQATCGCGNGLIKYEGEASNTNFFLTCRPYSDKYNHPMKIVIPKDCQLLKDHEENKHLREEVNEYNVLKRDFVLSQIHSDEKPLELLPMIFRGKDLSGIRKFSELKKKAAIYDELFPNGNHEGVDKSIQDILRENKNMRIGLQAHREALYKEQCLYQGLKLEFEDLAKEDCSIRQQAIKDIDNLLEKLAGEKLLSETRRKQGIEMLLVIKVFKEELETMTNVSSFYLKKATALRQIIKEIEALVNSKSTQYAFLIARIKEELEKETIWHDEAEHEILQLKENNSNLQHDFDLYFNKYCNVNKKLEKIKELMKNGSISGKELKAILKD